MEIKVRLFRAPELFLIMPFHRVKVYLKRISPFPNSNSWVCMSTDMKGPHSVGAHECFPPTSINRAPTVCQTLGYGQYYIVKNSIASLPPSISQSGGTQRTRSDTRIVVAEVSKQRCTWDSGKAPKEATFALRHSFNRCLLSASMHQALF